MMSPQPEAVKRWGEAAMISVSITMATGAWAASDVFPSGPCREAWEDTRPSWEAAVGTLTKDMPPRKEEYFATSMGRPPPTPIRKSKELSLRAPSTSSTSPRLASLMTCSSASIFTPFKASWTRSPAILFVTGSSTINAFPPNLSLAHTRPTSSRAPWPTTTLRGSSMLFHFKNSSAPGFMRPLLWVWLYIYADAKPSCVPHRQGTLIADGLSQPVAIEGPEKAETTTAKRRPLFHQAVGGHPRDRSLLS